MLRSSFSSFNALEQIERCKKAHVDSLHITTKCHWGYSYYPTEMGIMHPSLKGRDMVGELVSESRKAGIEAIAYYCFQFENLAAVLRCEPPKRPTLFEFFLNADLYARLADEEVGTGAAGQGDWQTSALQLISAFRNAGYDYVTLSPPGFRFPYGEADQQETRSLNEGAIITDRESFESYPWPDPDEADWGALARLSDHLGPGMKVIVPGPMGVPSTLPNTRSLPVKVFPSTSRSISFPDLYCLRNRQMEGDKSSRRRLCSLLGSLNWQTSFRL